MPEGREGAYQAVMVTRTIDAAREKVWLALTQPAHLRMWWRPVGSAVLGWSIDVRPNGFFLVGLRHADGTETWVRHVYQDIWPPTQLSFVESYSDSGGRALRRPHWPNWPIEVVTTLSLAKSGSVTKLTIRSLPRSATDTERSAFDRERFTLLDALSSLCERLNHHASAM